ncbi:MAG: DUF1836 domain-containing protein [Hominisplanchenecus sp.]
MTINTDQLLESILESLDRVDYIRPQDIPDIQLYMDQVTTFMDTHLASTRRYPEDKILTKTMINNYAKNNLIPPPEKKKYSREHMMLMIFIYYFKSFLSITDIQALMSPLTEKYFQKEGGFNLESVYNEVFQMEKPQVERLKDSVRELYRTSKDTFQDAPEDDRDFLQQFSFICLLSFDVYLKKQMIERLIDKLPKPDPKKKK